MVTYVEQYSIDNIVHGISRDGVANNYVNWSNGCAVGSYGTLNEARAALLKYAKDTLSRKINSFDHYRTIASTELANLEVGEHDLARNVLSASLRPENSTARVVYDALVDNGVPFRVIPKLNDDVVDVFHLWNPDVYVKCIEEEDAANMGFGPIFQGILICGNSAAKEFYKMLQAGVGAYWQRTGGDAG